MLPLPERPEQGGLDRRFATRRDRTVAHQAASSFVRLSKPNPSRPSILPDSAFQQRAVERPLRVDGNRANPTASHSSALQSVSVWMNASSSGVSRWRYFQ
jgi:hypothetical protein